MAWWRAVSGDQPLITEPLAELGVTIAVRSDDLDRRGEPQ